MKAGELPLIEQLRDEIRNSGQSLNQLARNAGLGPDQLSRFLRGERTLTLPAVAKVCEALGLGLSRQRPVKEGGPAGEAPSPGPKRPGRKRRMKGGPKLRVIPADGPKGK
jgi:DNA-binding phage protein